jgi:hypothetical protein
MKGDKTITHKSFSASPRAACSCLCCKNPEKSGAGLSGGRASWSESSQGGISPPSQSIMPRTGPPPRGARAAWWGGEGDQVGFQRGKKRGGKKPFLEWKELPVRTSVFHISYCQRPISPARGPCQCDKRAADDSQSCEQQDSPPAYNRSLAGLASYLLVGCC